MMRLFFWEMFDEGFKRRIDYGHAIAKSDASAKRMATKRLPDEFFFSDWTGGLESHYKRCFSKRFMIQRIGRSEQTKADWYSLKQEDLT